jgi:hypothetical protein
LLVLVHCGKSATADCTEQLQRPDRIAVSPQKKLPQICI